jgi:nucleotide-binding universal stress UspA family protein
MNQSYHARRILVPVDGSEFSRYAAEEAIRMAQTYGSEVIFLHVVDREVVEALAQREGDGQSGVRDRLFQNGQVYLRDVARLAEEFKLTHREEVAEGDPSAVICDTAARADVDLIVMGRIGRRGARAILVGSITRRVIECCDRAVLVVPGPARSRQAQPSSQN